jgi:hypothetical protein
MVGKIKKENYSTFFVLSLIVFCFSFRTAMAGTAAVSWNANSESDLAGYLLYYDTVSHAGTCPTGYANSVDVGNVTSYALNNLPNGHVYYFQLTAYDNASPRNVSACSTNPGEVFKVITYPGDLDNNRNVNIFDYNILVTNFGSTSSGNPADIDKNGVVNIFDYNLLIADFGGSF